MNSSSTRPTIWDVARDEAFFRIVQSVFPSALLEAFTVLLAGYDDAAVPADRGAVLEPADRRDRRRIAARPVPRSG